MNDIIVLDNRSTTSTFPNPRMVHGIRKATNPIKLATNAGELELKWKATVQGFGTVWYDPNLTTNIFSFAELNELHNITYNSTKEKAFIVHLSNKKIKFTKTETGLYLYKPNDYVLRNDIKIAGVANNNTNKMKNENENYNTNYKKDEETIEFDDDNNENETNKKLFEDYE